MKPRIGITSGLGGEHWREGGSSWQSYARAVESAGGEAVHLDPRTCGREAAVLAELRGSPEMAIDMLAVMSARLRDLDDKLSHQ